MRFSLGLRLAALALSCLLLCACGNTRPGPAEDFSYADKAFTASIRGTFIRLRADGYGGAPALVGETRTGVVQSFAATVIVGSIRDAAGTAATGDGTGSVAGQAAVGAAPREIAITFAEPPALTGVTVTRRSENGGSLVTLQRQGTEMEITADDSAAPGTYDALLRFAEALLPTGDITAVSPTENGCRTVTRTEGDRVAVFTFVDGISLPTRVTLETDRERLEMTVSTP